MGRRNWYKPQVQRVELPTRKSDTPLVCYRAWSLVKDERGPALRSVTAGVTWDGPILRGGGPPANAIPYTFVYGTPAPNSDYGIFAYRESHGIVSIGNVWGEIEVFGKVVVHELGVRAECARIRRLLVPRTTELFHRDRSNGWTVSFVFVGANTAAPVVQRPKPEVTDETIAQLAERYQCDVAWWDGPFAK